MNIAKLLLPLAMLLTINGASITPVSAEPMAVIADGFYDNYACPGSYRRYPYWVQRHGYYRQPIQCGQRRRFTQYRYRGHRRHYQFRRHRHGHCR